MRVMHVRPAAPVQPGARRARGEIKVHIHPPKPVHGWRAFIGEIGIIVIGIGIALGAEQLLEARHWRHVVAEESAALDKSVEGLWGVMTHRVAIQPCVDRRLAELAVVFDRHDRGQPLGIAAPIGRPSIFSADRNALDMATDDGSLSHMPLDRKLAYFGVYGDYEIFAVSGREERDIWRSLKALNHAATLSPGDWAALRKAYDGAIDSNSIMKTNLSAKNENSWLTAFAKFPRWPIVRTSSGLPYEVELCAPMLAGRGNPTS